MVAVSPDSPSFMQRLHSDEYFPEPLPAHVARAAARAGSMAEKALDRSDHRFWAGRQGTAAGLIALNHEFGQEFFRVPREAVDDLEAADEALGGRQTVIDVQTHYLADRREANLVTEGLLAEYRSVMPSWWRGLDDLTSYNFAEYLRCVFTESETAVAVLTSAPGQSPTRMLFNEEMAGTRRLLDELTPAGRMLNHAVVHPTDPREIELMSTWAEQLKPAGWKVYTLGQLLEPGLWAEGAQWMLDDEQTGVPFLERVRELDIRLVCVHKGLSRLVNAGSPVDVGPAAKAFPDITFLIYHSGYEWPVHGMIAEEGEYSEETAHLGTNRLVKSLKDNGLGPGCNVYAELGTTWFALLRRPRDAAHVLGKLLAALGEDNVIWGTDSIWYGPTQPLIDAFRAFQIPLDMRQQFGYPELTPLIKEKILSLNAARVYSIDLDQVRSSAESDSIAWIKEAAEFYRKHGNPTL
jgi:uncharacterized protein